MIRGRPIYLGGNDDEPEKAVTRKNVDTGDVEALSGVTVFTFFLAATKTGAAIHASLSKPAVERGTLGVYWAVFEGTDLVTHLTAYVGLDIFERFGNQADVDFVVVRKVLAVRP